MVQDTEDRDATGVETVSMPATFMPTPPVAPAFPPSPASPVPPGSGGDKRTQRQLRQAAALRANLLRRKEQARVQAQTQDDNGSAES